MLINFTLTLDQKQTLVLNKQAQPRGKNLKTKHLIYFIVNAKQFDGVHETTTLDRRTMTIGVPKGHLYFILEIQKCSNSN